MSLDYFKRTQDGRPLPMRTTEVETIRHDFTDDLAAGETLSGAGTSAIRVYRGTDAGPTDVLSGAATQSGAIVAQQLDLTNAVDGVTYVVDLIATTSESNIKVRAGLVWVSDDPDARPPV